MRRASHGHTTMGRKVAGAATKQASVMRNTYPVNVSCLDPDGKEAHADTDVHAALFDLRTDSGPWTQHLFNEPPGYALRYGQKVTIGNIRIRPGYALDSVTGATRNSDGTYSLTVTGAATIAIKTKLAQFSVAFDANGGVLDGPASVTEEFGSTVTAPVARKAGHHLKQWVPVKAGDAQWVQVMYQSPMAAWFGNAATAQSTNSLDLYSTLGQLEGLRSAGRWEFLLEGAQWPGKAMHWRQTSNPVASALVTGFEAVSLSWDSSAFKGLSTSSASTALACHHNTGGFWWYAIGAYQSYCGGVPVVAELGSGSGVAYQPISLYVRSDSTLSTLSRSYSSGYAPRARIPVRAQSQLFKAVWEPNSLAVSFSLNGGGGTSTPDAVAVACGRTLQLAQVPAAAVCVAKSA